MRLNEKADFDISLYPQGYKLISLGLNSTQFIQDMQTCPVSPVGLKQASYHEQMSSHLRGKCL